MWSAFRRHLSYANIATTFAVVFSMSAGAVAATHYVINSTRQVNPKVLKKLKGKTGPTGVTGVTGAPGPQGSAGKNGTTVATGPSTASNTNSGSDHLPFPSTSGAELTVSSLSLPAGNFSVVGKLIANNNGPVGLDRCELILGETPIDPGFDGIELGQHPNDRESIVLAGIGSLSSPGTAKIICRFALAKVPGTAAGTYEDRSVTAIQVGSLG
jgi:hypothetical protein